MAESSRSFACVHGVVVITPRNLVVSALFLSPRVEFFALNLIRTEIREAHECFNKLEGIQIP